MAKQHVQSKHTEMSLQHGVGSQMEATITYDDSCIPSPADLAKYKEIDPDIVKHFLDTAKLEQSHRQRAIDKRIETIAKANQREHTTNITGMVLATIIILAIVTMTILALYWNRAWLPEIGFITAIISAAALFVKKGNAPNKKQTEE